MFGSSTQAWVFTLAFALTGGYALVRLALVGSGTERHADPVAELAHLLMSIAMIAMTWGATGGPGSASGLLQIAVFGVLALWFLGQAVVRAPGHGRLTNADHLVTTAAMVWMVAAMPALMGMTEAAGDADPHAAHTGHGATAATEMAPAAPTPGWVTALTWAFVALLVASGVLWASRGLRAVPYVPDETGHDPAGPAQRAVAVATRSPRTRLARLSGPRADAVCHCVMSLGMAAMLLAML